jgi:hypothetical protein
MNPTRQMVVHGVAIVAVLGAIAAIAPAPASSDRGIYERVGRELLIRDCADGHCFRPLVAGVLEHLPGASLVKWKAYAVIANAVAAVAVGQFCLLLGILPAAALAATWIAALGTGALYSLFDSYTSDPLMYMLGPVMAIALWQGRDARAGGLAAIGVFAKEFAAAPMWIFTVFAALERRWAAAVRLLLTATAVTLVWLLLQTTLMALQNYRYGASASADLLHGGPEAAGFMTTGGTESILLAVKAARTRGHERGIDAPEMVLPTSAHAAFEKGAAYFGVRSVRIPVRADYRVDPDAMAAAVNANTVLLVASAPQYPQGVIDPVTEIAALAAARDINCHVDACMGGFVLPIMFGALMDLTGIRSSAFMLMYGVVWVSLIWMYWTEVRRWIVAADRILSVGVGMLHASREVVIILRRRAARLVPRLQQLISQRHADAEVPSRAAAL